MLGISPKDITCWLTARGTYFTVVNTDSISSAVKQRRRHPQKLEDNGSAPSRYVKATVHEVEKKLGPGSGSCEIYLGPRYRLTTCIERS